MLNKIKVTPIAAESFGVRSMCTFVETPDVRMLLDAGISLCPNRFGLPPHPIEFQTIARLRKRISEAAEKTEIVTISHYHFDHHTPSFEDWVVNWTEADETARQIYEGKRVLLKNPREKINPSQRQRAWMFQRTGGRHAKTLEIADGKEFKFGKETVLRFSEPVTHGPENAMLGWVIMAEVECGEERFVFAPDVQGPISNSALELIKDAKPDVLMVGGPPFYLGSFKVDEAITILEHHTLRGASWHERTREAFESAHRVGNIVETAAEYAGKESVFLESRRKQLYDENPPSREFERWMRGISDKTNKGKPPL
jgi:predicted metallo-beta-lactamase superfamily hydrolase